MVDHAGAFLFNLAAAYSPPLYIKHGKELLAMALTIHQKSGY